MNQAYHLAQVTAGSFQLCVFKISISPNGLNLAFDVRPIIIHVASSHKASVCIWGPWLKRVVIPKYNVIPLFQNTDRDFVKNCRIIYKSYQVCTKIPLQVSQNYSTPHEYNDSFSVCIVLRNKS